MQTVRTGRAAPLSPEDRRAAIVAAALPLLREQGSSVSTRDLAAAAGVAEGTLFRVFEDKKALLHAVLESVIDAGPVVAELGGIDPAAPLAARLEAVIRLLGDQMDGVVDLMTLLRDAMRPGREGHDRGPRELGPHGRGRGGPGGLHGHGGPHGPGGPHEAFEEAHRATTEAIVALLAPDADRLRVSPREAATLISAVLLGERMQSKVRRERLDPVAVSAVLTAGLLAEPPPS